MIHIYIFFKKKQTSLQLRSRACRQSCSLDFKNVPCMPGNTVAATSTGGRPGRRGQAMNAARRWSKPDQRLGECSSSTSTAARTTACTVLQGGGVRIHGRWLAVLYGHHRVPSVGPRVGPAVAPLTAHDRRQVSWLCRLDSSAVLDPSVGREGGAGVQPGPHLQFFFS